MKVSKRRYAGLLVKNLLLGTLPIAVSISPAVLSEALADPLDKTSPKIALFIAPAAAASGRQIESPAGRHRPIARHQNLAGAAQQFGPQLATPPA